jgi:hypothetical protein
MAWAPCCRAVAIRPLIAFRSRPSRVPAGSPARSSGTVTGVPRTLPSAATTATARCPAFTSTATTGWRLSSSSGGTVRGAVFHEACRYHRFLAASSVMSYRIAPVAACAATSSPR